MNARQQANAILVEIEANMRAAGGWEFLGGCSTRNPMYDDVFHLALALRSGDYERVIREGQPALKMSRAFKERYAS